MSNSTHPRCAICGQEILPKTMAFQVQRVEHGPRGGTTEHGQWGEAHELCFLRQTGGPSLMKLLKRTAAPTPAPTKRARPSVSV